MGAALTTKIPIKDRDGRIIDEKEVATYAGLLAKAHEEGLSAITTRLLQVPCPDNGDTAIVEVHDAIPRGAFPPNPSWMCPRCEFRGACRVCEGR